MLTLIVLICVVLFLFGLVQWARGGAVLWEVFRTSKTDRDSAHKELESMADELLKSSFRIVGVLGLCVLAFIMVTIVIDLLQLDWLDKLSFRANRFWGNPAARSTVSETSRTNRDDIWRSMGSRMRR